MRSDRLGVFRLLSFMVAVHTKRCVAFPSVNTATLIITQFEIPLLI